MADFSRLNLRGTGSSGSGAGGRDDGAGDGSDALDGSEALVSSEEGRAGSGDSSVSGSSGSAGAGSSSAGRFRVSIPGRSSADRASDGGVDSGRVSEVVPEGADADSVSSGDSRVDLSRLRFGSAESVESRATGDEAIVDDGALAGGESAVVGEDSLSGGSDAVESDLVLVDDDGEGLLDVFPADTVDGFDAVNPLLDDDEEELWSGAEEVAEPGSMDDVLRSVTGEVMDREDIDDADYGTFGGFDSSGAVNPLLEDDDEEDEFSSLEVEPERADAEVDSQLAELHERVKVSAKPKRFFPKGLDEDFDRRKEEAPARKEAVAAERESEIRKKKSEMSKAQEFKSDFIRRPVETLNVNENGETRSEAARERVRGKAGSPGGRMSPKEIEFFKNVGKRRADYSKGVATMDLMSGPLNEFATTKERTERTEKLQRAFDSRKAYRGGADFRLNEKMIQMISFLALFRYSTHSHMSRMFGESQRTTLDRLYKMKQNGIVDSRKIYAQHSIWFLTEPGMIVSGYDLRRITDARLTYSMFPHQFTVNHTAANLWGGKLNVLGLSDFPSKNRVNLRGERVLGETLTSELEILSSFSKMKLFEDSSSFRPKLMEMMSQQFQKWANSDDRATTPSPEMIHGNEWMFTLFPSLAVKLAYHVPDLVVKRQRDASGAPRSLAVEVEISNKPVSTYERTLQAYAEDNRIFSKVVWVCKTIGPAKKLEKIGRELGIIQSGKLKIVPIYTNDGVFRGRDLWMI